MSSGLSFSRCCRSRVRKAYRSGRSRHAIPVLEHPVDHPPVIHPRTAQPILALGAQRDADLAGSAGAGDRRGGRGAGSGGVGGLVDHPGASARRRCSPPWRPEPHRGRADSATSRPSQMIMLAVCRGADPPPRSTLRATAVAAVVGSTDRRQRQRLHHVHPGADRDPDDPARPRPTVDQASPRARGQELQHSRDPCASPPAWPRHEHPRTHRPAGQPPTPRTGRRPTTRIRPDRPPAPQRGRTLLSAAHATQRHRHPIRQDRHVLPRHDRPRHAAHVALRTRPSERGQFVHFGQNPGGVAGEETLQSLDVPVQEGVEGEPRELRTEAALPKLKRPDRFSGLSRPAREAGPRTREDYFCGLSSTWTS